MTTNWKKLSIEIENVTVSGSAYASSNEGTVFVPKHIAEDADVCEGDIIFSTVRVNYPDKIHIARFICSRLHVDHALTQLVEHDEEVIEDEGVPQTKLPDAFSNVVPLVAGTELIDAAYDHLFIILLDLPDRELDELVLDVLHHEPSSSMDVLFSILCVQSIPQTDMGDVQKAAYHRVHEKIVRMHREGKLVEAAYTSFDPSGQVHQSFAYATTQRALDVTLI